MRRTLPTWLALGACVALACAGMAYLSAIALRLERAEADARAAAFVEERVRLALWRMDGRLARLIAQESARPVEHYQPLFVPERAVAPTKVASPLLEGPPEGVLLHFVLRDDGALSSPQLPGDEEADAASVLGYSASLRARTLLALLEKKVDRAALRKLQPAPVAVARAQPQVQEQGVIEYSKRAQQFVSNAAYGSAEPAASKEVSAMSPTWMAGELLLVRRVEGAALQGAWLDWSALKAQLLEEVRDLLPQAALEPVAKHEPGGLVERQLASLPLRLVPGDVPPPPGEPSAVKPVLFAAWVALVLALAAVGFLLFGALSLSERRAAFVSAVTHELRTPLTTFRMYAEMLAEGMVTDEAQRRSYFETLQRESNRLAHLVENVLSYARLERRRAPRAMSSSSLHALLREQLRRSEERAAEVGMTLEVEVDPSLTVLAEPAAFEQVVFNLVDNACKYAAQAQDKRILLRAERRGRRVALLVSDRGSGIPKDVARTLFEPFTKSSEQAADSAPGVGLGLALSRRLARAMGGELRYEGDARGACFALLLVDGDRA